MSAFVGKLRRVGNSMSVLVPSKVIKELGAQEGDEFEFVTLRPVNERLRLRNSAIGSFPELAGLPFERDRNDRY